MPQVSCNTCIQSIYGTDVQICDCSADVSKPSCGHWRRHHAEINDLCTSARSGCRMCSELWRFFFKEKTPEQYLSGIMPGVEGQGFPIGGSAHVFFGSGTSFRVAELADRSGGERAQGDGEDLVLALDFSINSPMIYEVEERRYILKKTSDYERLFTLFASGILQLDDKNDDIQDLSKKRWDWVRTWMGDCADEGRHSLCARALQAIQSSSYLPTRLIEVAPMDDKDGCRYYRLLEMAEALQGPHRYATLSHVWGGDQQPAYRTIASNYEERLRCGIPRDILPACFQDAIDAAERIGIPYIWIDSLCIIQDDPIDCPAEAGRMDQVYSNSFLNLSATASSSSKDRLPSMAKADRLQEPRFVGTVWSGRYAGTYQILDPHFWADRVTSTRVASRGWIFQERALAPRVLHFGFDQVLWECAESERAEEFPHGLPLRSADARRQEFKWNLNTDPLQDATANYKASTLVAERDPRQDAILAGKWVEVITQYSRCELTKPQDKLIAISGVAKLLAHRFDDTYTAGLWKSNLIGGLCWRVPKMRRTTQDLIPSGLYARRWEPSRRLSANGAPSWSWASVDGEIEPGSFLSSDPVPFSLASGLEGYATHTSMLHSTPEIDIFPKMEENPFGELDTKRSRLELHATTYPLELCASATPQTYMFRHFGTETFLAVHLDQPEDPGNVKDTCFLPMIQSKHFVVSGSESVSDGVHRRDLDSVVGILIKPGEREGMYSRIGMYECPAERLERLVGETRWVCLE